MQHGLKALALVVLLAGPVVANAVLTDIGGGLIYDSALNVTWLQDANYANSSGYAAATGGRMTWATAMNWASSLSYYDSVRNMTLTGWQLPTVFVQNHQSTYGGTDAGWNMTPGNSQLADLYSSSLGNIYYCDTLGNCPQSSWTGQVNVGPFVNVNVDGNSPINYWYGTLNPSYSLGAFDFTFFGGRQNNGSTIFADQYAMAYVIGDVRLFNAVPEPGTLALLGLGLAGLGFARRRKLN